MTLIDSPVLYLDQIRSASRIDFTIYGENEAPVGSVTTEGNVLARMLSGPRRLVVSDHEGAAFVLVEDVPNLGRDRLEILSPSGGALATVTKEFTFVRKVLTVTIGGEPSFELRERDMAETNFQIVGAVGPLANVSRFYPGFAARFMNKSSYCISFAGGIGIETRQAILGTVVSVAVIRAKERTAVRNPTA